MDGIVKLLDEKLDYVSHEIKENEILIQVKSNRQKVICPYCQNLSSKEHSRYPRRFQDLPIQGKKVIMIIENRKMFCTNTSCNRTTFAESFPFLSRKSRRTERLENEILSMSLNCSSVAAARHLSKNVVDIGKTTICKLLKKQRINK